MKPTSGMASFISGNVCKSVSAFSGYSTTPGPLLGQRGDQICLPGQGVVKQIWPYFSPQNFWMWGFNTDIEAVPHWLQYRGGWHKLTTNRTEQIWNIETSEYDGLCIHTLDDQRMVKYFGFGSNCCLMLDRIQNFILLNFLSRCGLKIIWTLLCSRFCSWRHTDQPNILWR